ncbi:MAG: hypothetical protein CMP84_13870 [Gammaproteobacteria bacterium]|nr:hypothetical protein [Gammaproteobacteria bacterium]
MLDLLNMQKKALLLYHHLLLECWGMQHKRLYLYQAQLSLFELLGYNLYIHNYNHKDLYLDIIVPTHNTEHLLALSSELV